MKYCSQFLLRANREGKRLWGDLLGKIFEPAPDVRLLNLETAVTTTIDNPDVPNKGINYHMHCANLAEAFSAFSQEGHGGSEPVPYIVSFSNNHVMDFGRKAFEQETLPALETIPVPGTAIGAGTTWKGIPSFSR